MEESERSVSSLMDTWISLQDLEANGERNRVLYLLKSRGMDHSKQLREYVLSSEGINLVDVYLGPDGVLTGAARMAQEARERDAERARQQDEERRRREVARKRAAVERQIAELRAAVDAEESEAAHLSRQEEVRSATVGSDRQSMALRRGATHGRE